MNCHCCNLCLANSRLRSLFKSRKQIHYVVCVACIVALHLNMLIACVCMYIYVFVYICVRICCRFHLLFSSLNAYSAKMWTSSTIKMDSFSMVCVVSVPAPAAPKHQYQHELHCILRLDKYISVARRPTRVIVYTTLQFVFMQFVLVILNTQVPFYHLQSLCLSFPHADKFLFRLILAYPSSSYHHISHTKLCTY